MRVVVGGVVVAVLLPEAVSVQPRPLHLCDHVLAGVVVVVLLPAVVVVAAVPGVPALPLLVGEAVVRAGGGSAAAAALVVTLSLLLLLLLLEPVQPGVHPAVPGGGGGLQLGLAQLDVWVEARLVRV